MTTLRDLVGQQGPLDSSDERHRNKVEEAIGALMPGDDPADHPLHSPPNPYLTRRFSELKAMLQSGELGIDDERQVRAALDMQQLQHSDGRPMGVRRAGDDEPEPEPDPSRSPLRPAW
jgi:hypothetical protein